MPHSPEQVIDHLQRKILDAEEWLDTFSREVGVLFDLIGGSMSSNSVTVANIHTLINKGEEHKEQIAKLRRQIARISGGEDPIYVLVSE